MGEPFLFTPLAPLILFGGVVADLLLGDGDFAFHPIRLMGAAISWAEKRARGWPLPEFYSGAVMALALVLVVYIGVDWLEGVLRATSTVFFLLFSILSIYFSLCLKCLAQEANKVYSALIQGELDRARYAVSMLVSRDTSQMDPEAISRAAVESVAENLVDGIISPYFYGVLGGPALALTFKMISTLDSMIGYRNARYERFGKVAARLDDMANYVPARLSVLMIGLGALVLTGLKARRVFCDAFKLASLHQSPNSGFPEAAFALALDIRLGGPVSYHGTIRRYPYINREGKEVEPEDIRRAVRLLYTASFLTYAVPFGVLLLLA